ncbi:hypothetical protein [Cupriavidus basilensis]|uniref:hypothetical protein n=1 Tax=Cupriavidus basilensis TaxID=68895 RepID=UPI00157A7187|nr:hypothetical protein [Cupriavidus basilensis]NUA25989.1 hypothetical protein [Cupriavidus basilensis]
MIEWVSELSEDVRKDLLYLGLFSLSEYAPGLEFKVEDGGFANFAAWLTPKDGERPRIIKSKITTVCAHFAPVIAERSTSEAWNKAHEDFERAIATIKQDGILIESARQSMIKSCEHTLAGFPERESAWRAAAASWEALCKGLVSTAEIGAWIDRESAREFAELVSPIY